jgi:hypothetical protein
MIAQKRLGPENQRAGEAHPRDDVRGQGFKKKALPGPFRVPESAVAIKTV